MFVIWFKNNAQFNKELEPLLKDKAKKMLGHLKSISFKNGTVPHFNDTTNGGRTNYKCANKVCK